MAKEKATAAPSEFPEEDNFNKIFGERKPTATAPFGPFHDSVRLDQIAASLAEIVVLLKNQQTPVQHRITGTKKS